MACQSQRGLPLLPTNDHISSISASASPARSRSQATSAGFSVRSTAVFTDSSTGAFFLSSRSTVLGQICSERAVSRTPLALRLMSMIMCLTLRQAPAIAVVEQETALRTEGVLTEIALGTPSRFAAFDDLVTLAMRAADGDERHGPFLPKRGYEDEAQCDINPSLSPLLKHYRRLKPVNGARQVRSRAQRPRTLVFSLVSFYYRGAAERS